MGGSLIAFDGEMRLTYSKAAKPPSAVVLSSAGGFVSIEAVRFAARARIAIVAIDRAHSFISILTPSGSANARSLRAQCAADPLPIARSIVAAKIEAMRAAGAISFCVVHESTAALGDARSIERVRIIEAQAARVAWPNPRAHEMDERLNSA